MNTDNESDIKDSYINIDELNELLDEDYFGVQYRKNDEDYYFDKYYYFDIYDYIHGGILTFKNMELDHMEIVIPKYITSIYMFQCSLITIDIPEGTKLKNIHIHRCVGVIFNKIHNLKKLNTLSVEEYTRFEENTFNDIFNKLYRFGKIKRLYLRQDINDEDDDDNDYEIEECKEYIDRMIYVVKNNIYNKKDKVDDISLTYQVVDKLMPINREHKNIFTDMIMAYL